MSLIAGYIYHLVARQGLAANVPTLLTGEIGWDTDTKTLRMGDLTPEPPKIMSTKSTGNFDFSLVNSFTIGGVTIGSGLVDGVDLSQLNATNGFLVRKGNNIFGTASFVSGDSSIQIIDPTGTSGTVDIRFDLANIPDAAPGVRGLFQFPVTSENKILQDNGVWIVPPTSPVVFPVPPSGTAYLRDDNVWAVPPGGGGGLSSIVGYSVLGVTGAATALPVAITAGSDGFILRRTGGVLAFGTLPVESIADGSITDAKLADMPGLSVKGRPSNTTGVPSSIVAGVDGYVLKRSGTTLGFGQVTDTGIANNAVSNAKLANATAWSIKMRNAGTTGDVVDATSSNIATEASPASGDFVFLFDVSTGQFKKSSVSAIGALSTGPINGSSIGSYYLQYIGAGGQAINAGGAPGTWVVRGYNPGYAAGYRLLQRTA